MKPFKKDRLYTNRNGESYPLRTCGSCRKELVLTEFCRRKDVPSGRSYICKTCHSEHDRHWREDNPLRMRQLRRRQTEKLKAKVYALLGDVCCQCGYSDERAICIDHKKGDGHSERKQHGSCRLQLYRRVLKFPDNYQLLCANCNLIKAKENNELGYKKDPATYLTRELPAKSPRVRRPGIWEDEVVCGSA